MIRTMLAYGGIAGAIVITVMSVSLNLGGVDGAAGSMLVGYLIMLVALSLIFVGIKRYRDQTLGGVIRFGPAFGLGLGIAVVAAVVYVIGWEISLAITDYRFMDDYARAVIEAERAAGATPAELAAKQAEMAQMKESYANPLFRMAFTFIEVFPVGLIVALVSAALLRNSRVLPARASA